MGRQSKTTDSGDFCGDLEAFAALVVCGDLDSALGVRLEKHVYGRVLSRWSAKSDTQPKLRRGANAFAPCSMEFHDI